MRLRGDHGILRQRHYRTPRVVGLRKLLHKRLRRSCHQRQLDVLPVFSDRVVDDGPALQQRLAFVRDHDSISALPHRDFADVADQQIALALAGGGDGHAAHVLIAGGGDEAEIFSHFIIHIFLGHANTGGWIQIEDADFSAVADDGNLINGDFLVAFDGNLALVDAEKASRGGFRAAADFEARAAQGIQKLGRGWVLAYGQMQGAETPLEGSVRVVADAGDASLAEIEDGQGLQHVIQLRGGELYVYVLAVAHPAGVLEVADAVLVENDAGYGQSRGRISGGTRLAR